jgi:excinuclease ABC subunit C
MGKVPRTAAALPQAPGVYRFRAASGRVLYVGRATELRRRVGSYWAPLGDRAHLAPMVAAVAGIEALACASVHEAAWLERNLLEQAMPPYNRTPGGQETPVYLRLSTDPDAPGLTLTHTPTGSMVFGPYLGGTRVRLALAALHRVLPLAYTGARCNGTQRDLARSLHITYRDRDRLATALSAVLRREPDAVAAADAQLRVRREQAVEALAFEVAARIQDELHALEWLTSVQRVTTLEPVDLDAHGWHDGVLVRLSVRTGQLRGWTQWHCSRADAQPHLDSTPPAWAEFAQHNATLAATLAAGAPV